MELSRKFFHFWFFVINLLISLRGGYMAKKKLSEEDKFNAVMDLLEGRGKTSEICMNGSLSNTGSSGRQLKSIVA